MTSENSFHVRPTWLCPSVRSNRAEVMGRRPDMPGRWSWEIRIRVVDGVRCSKTRSSAGGHEYGLLKSWPRSRADGCRQSETGARRLAEFRSTVLRAE